MNGDRYAVWAGYVGTSVRAWEARVTPGRNCTSFRAVLGLADTSHDGSSGVISFTTDEATTIYQSPTLTPGMTLPVTLDLARPYRFGMAAANTSADKVQSYPMVGELPSTAPASRVDTVRVTTPSQLLHVVRRTVS